MITIIVVIVLVIVITEATKYELPVMSTEHIEAAGRPGPSLAAVVLEFRVEG